MASSSLDVHTNGTETKGEVGSNLESEVECIVCCERYTKVKKAVVCLYCQKQSCQKCYEQYILNSLEMAKCMHCQKQWNDEFIHANFTQTFYKDKLKKHKENILLQKEMAILSESQLLVPFEKKKQQLQEKNKKLNAEQAETVSAIAVLTSKRKRIYNQITRNHRKLNIIHQTMERDLPTLIAESVSLEKIFRMHHMYSNSDISDDSGDESDNTEDNTENNADANGVARKKSRSGASSASGVDSASGTNSASGTGSLSAAGSSSAVGTSSSTVVVAPKVVAPRPIKRCETEECRGFVTTLWTCGVCNVKYCKHCLEVIPRNSSLGEGMKGDGHECKKENVESAQIILKECKPCPKCYTMIFKSQGCNQMFCTRCNCIFDWATLKLCSSDNFHNPHYMEFIRNNRIVENVDCDQAIPRLTELAPVVRHTSIFSLVGLVNHIRGVVLRHPQYNNLQRPNYNVYRANYLMNLIDETKFKRKMQQDEKRFEFYEACAQVFNTIVMVGGEISRAFTVQRLRLVPGEEVSQRIAVAVANIKKFIDYVNEELTKIAKRFNVNRYFIRCDTTYDFSRKSNNSRSSNANADLNANTNANAPSTTITITSESGNQ